MSKTMMIGELFEMTELERAYALYREDPGTFHKRVLAEIVEPAMARINAVTGQENDPSYMTYMLEYAVSQAETRPEKG